MRALIGVTLVFALATTFGASAADWYTGVPTDGPVAPPAPSVAIDVAVDGTSQRALSGAMIGTIAAFSTLDKSGLRFRVSGLGGRYDYNSSATATAAAVGRVNGTLVNGAVMMGYEWVMKNMTIAAFGGAEIVNNSISPNDPNNTVKGTRGGFRVGVDFYLLPTDRTMVSGVAYYSTNNSAYYGRLKFGMAFAERVYVGPEVVALGDNFFQQFRVGGHLSGLQFGAIQMGVSAGFLADRVRGAGVYGILESRVTF